MLLSLLPANGSDTGRRVYAKRKQTVETVFGIIKEVLGFRQFRLRGLVKVEGEWSLIHLAYNVKRLWALEMGAPISHPRDPGLPRPPIIQHVTSKCHSR